MSPSHHAGSCRAGLTTGDHRALGVADATHERRPRLGARAAGPDVTGHAPAVVTAGRGGPEDLAGPRVRHPEGRLGAVLVDLELLQTRPGQVEVAHVYRVRPRSRRSTCRAVAACAGCGMPVSAERVRAVAAARPPNSHLFDLPWNRHGRNAVRGRRCGTVTTTSGVGGMKIAEKAVHPQMWERSHSLGR